MAKSQHVLRLKRTDAKSEHLLVNVTSAGTRPLDLKLIATDQNHIYHGSLEESGLKSLQATNFHGNLEEWKTTLSFALLQSLPVGPRPDFLEGVETVSSISGTVATITLRKNIDGITQRLGTIKLYEDDEKEEIQVFEWVDHAVASADELRTQMEVLQVSAASQKEQIAKLSKDLDDLMKAKKEHEDDMLSKFAALLNTKKLKIRDQQRLLTGARIDADTAEAVAKARISTDRTSRRPGASRAGKRKANGSRDPFEELSDGDGNDESDVQIEDGEEGSERLRQDTPETADEATEDEADEAQPDQFSDVDGGKAVETMDVDEDGSVLLPQRRQGQVPTPQRPTTNLEEDDDETDDEL